MRILMRNTVFKTAALAGLFLCMLAFGGAFFGTTTSAHAGHADEVDTQEELEEFVKEAVDEYYINFLIKGEEEHCDLRDLALPPLAVQALPTFLQPYGISDLSPASMRMLSTEQIKGLISLFNSLAVQAIIGDLDIWGACAFPPTSTFRDVFTEEAADWKSGSIYLFVMNDEKELLFHGDDEGLEGEVLEAIDEGDRDVGQLIVDEADDPMNNGIVKYCWDDPDVDGDEIVDSNGDPIEGKAPGDSLKVSYVIDPFSSLGVPAPSGSPGVIFGSGIYPETPDPELPECNGNGIAGDVEPVEPPTEPMPPPMEPGPGTPTSVSGGGCAIAGGGDSTPRNDALNLLLMVSTLFLAVSFGNRTAGRRNGIRS